MFAALYVAAGAPTPLLVVFEQQWHFPAWVLTVAFSSYALGLLAALLFAGSLSDYTGRRPVLVGSLLVEFAAMFMFVFAPDISWVIAARTIQGIATGAATSAFSASVVEHAPRQHKQLGTIITSIAPAERPGPGSPADRRGDPIQQPCQCDRVRDSRADHDRRHGGRRALRGNGFDASRSGSVPNSPRLRPPTGAP
ncbi:MFS transporter [Streptomyces lasalocidi]